MRVKVYGENILYLQFPTKKELTMTMARPQEYYECNSTKLRGKVFTFEKLVDHYMDDNGTVSYFDYWSGFNLPSTVLEEFFKKFELSDREQRLKNATVDFSSKGLYYVIAGETGDKETLDHELVHAHYFLDPSYRQKANVLVKHMRPELKEQMVDSLKRIGYTNKVLTDEINAYMSTSTLKYLRHELEVTVNRGDIKPFVNLAKTVLQK